MKKRLSLLLFLVSLVCCCFISNSMAQCSANAGEPTTATQSFTQGQAPTSINFSSGFGAPTTSGTSTQIAYLLTKNGDKFITAKADGEFYFNGNNDPNATSGSQYEAPLTGPLDTLCVSQVIYSAEEVIEFAEGINAYLETVNLGFLDVPENGDISEVAVFVQAILIAANPNVEATLAEILSFLEPGIITLENPLSDDPPILEIPIPELCFDVSTNKSCAAISCNVSAGNATGSTAYCYPEDENNLPSTLSAAGLFTGNTSDVLVDDISYILSGIGDTLITASDAGNFPLNTGAPLHDPMLANEGDQLCMYQMIYSSEELIDFANNVNVQIVDQGCGLIQIPTSGSLEDVLIYIQAILDLANANGTIADILSFITPGILEIPNPGLAGCADTIVLEIPALCLDISDTPYCYSYAACCATSASVDPIGSVCSNVPINLNGSIGGNATMGTWSTTGDGVFGNTGTLSTTYNPGPIEISNGAAQICLTTDDPDGPGACEATTECVFAFINTAGCIDSGACNFDPDAECDSGMCIYETACDTDPCTGGGIQVWDTASCGCVLQTPTVSGCTDPTACNYNSAANCNDGSCQPAPTCNSDPCLGDVTVVDPLNPCNCVLSAPQVSGCTDPTACNYNSAANCNDGSCQPAPTCNSDPCLGDVTVIDPLNPCNCVLSAAQMLGCTDPLACNYNSAANCNDGSCVYETACDTDPCTNGGTFVWDATSCGCVLQTATVTGCADATACNYDVTANCLDASCIYETACDADPCTGGGVQVWDATTCACALQTPTVTGCTDATACNYNSEANCDDSSCIIETACDADPCTGGGVQVWDATTCACALQTPTVTGCTDATACNYNSEANCDDSSCIIETGCDADPCTGGGVQVWDATTCACVLQTPTVTGCTDATACNYNANANCDDSSCIIETACDTDPCTGGGVQVWDATNCTCALQTPTVTGCMDATACNYNSAANCDDGSCLPVPTCNSDICAGDVTVLDPANPCQCILSEAQVLGCMTACAPNYNSAANCDDGSCQDCIEDCGDPTACNYNSAATVINNDLCNYGNAACADPCVPVSGCIDANACNFDSGACVDDGSCILETACDTDPCTNGGVYTWDTNTCACALTTSTVLGCNDPDACNYNADANCDDGTCILETACDTDPCINGGIYTWDANTCACALTTSTILGCNDPGACNYNADANCDDGSCILETACNADPCTDGGVQAWDDTTCQCEIIEPTILGCTSPCAPNYDANANCDNGSCEICPEGCKDMTACNFDADATVENNDLCEYGNIDCTDPCAPVSGCTDANACNYNADACVDDNSCILETACDTDPCTNGGTYSWNTTSCSCELNEATVLGCIDNTATNYDPAANCDDDSCIYDLGCKDMTACNYNPDPAVGEDNSLCNYGNADCADPCAPVSGCTDASACNYNADACEDDGSCILETACDDDPCTNGGIYTWDATQCECTLSEATIEGCTDDSSLNYNPDANCDDGSCGGNGNTHCDDPTACNYNPNPPSGSTSTPDICDFGNTDCPSPCNVTFGCIDANACNYNTDANCDDGSCVYGDPSTCNTDCTAGDIEEWDASSCSCVVTTATVSGCTDATACNYNADANCDDDSCEFGDPSTCNTDCTAGDITEWDASSCSCVVTTTTVSGCTDATACNYNADANCDDDSCVFIAAGTISTTDNTTTCSGDGIDDIITATVDGNMGSYTYVITDGTATTILGQSDAGEFNLEGAPAGTCLIWGVAHDGSLNAPTDQVADLEGCFELSNSIEVVRQDQLGCTDAAACNYDADAQCDDDSCVFIAAGTISTTDNTTTCSGDGVDDIITATVDGSMGSYTYVITDGTATTILGQSDSGEFNLEGAPGGTCLIWGVAHDGSLNAPTDQVADLEGCFELSNSIEVVRQDQLGCTDATACNYDADAQCDDGSCDFGDPSTCNTDCAQGDIEEWNAETCQCDVTIVTVPGCTDVNASNYNADANCDEGCEYMGCTDPCASNYDINALEDDGSCEEYDTTCNDNCLMGDLEIWDPETCGCVTSIQSIVGCTEKEACNFDPVANCNDGCDYSCYCTIEASVEVVCGPIGDKFQLVFLFSGSDNGSYLLTNNDTGDFLVIDQPFYQSPVYYTDENEGFSYTVSLTSDLDCNQTLSQTFVDCIVTAIDLVSFDGQATEQGNRLDWTSASEFNSDSYIVEKSTNGTDFYEIGTVKVAGNSNVKNDYYFLDKDVKSNVSYYRLVELDRSGAKEVVTDIVVITKESNNWDIGQIAPIPATDFINIDVNSVDETNYTLEIYNVAGKLIRTTEGNVVAGVSSLKIDISDLPIGTYFINLTNGRETQVARFVKN